MTLLDRGLAMLRRTLPQAAGVTVTYSRGASGVGLTAWVGRDDPRTDAPDRPQAGRLDGDDRDYLIPAAALIFAGVAVEPAKGDRIAETVGGRVRVYEVMPGPSGGKAWRWSDTAKTVYRVHTKPVS